MDTRFLLDDLLGDHWVEREGLEGRAAVRYPAVLRGLALCCGSADGDEEVRVVDFSALGAAVLGRRRYRNNECVRLRLTIPVRGAACELEVCGRVAAYRESPPPEGMVLGGEGSTVGLVFEELSRGAEQEIVAAILRAQAEQRALGRTDRRSSAKR